MSFNYFLLETIIITLFVTISEVFFDKEYFIKFLNHLRRWSYWGLNIYN